MSFALGVVAVAVGFLMLIHSSYLMLKWFRVKDHTEADTG